MLLNVIWTNNSLTILSKIVWLLRITVVLLIPMLNPPLFTFFAELVDILERLIEPSVDHRIPLVECEVHTWVSNGNKLVFFPFQSLPKDRPAKLQVLLILLVVQILFNTFVNLYLYRNCRLPCANYNPFPELRNITIPMHVLSAYGFQVFA